MLLLLLPLPRCLLFTIPLVLLSRAAAEASSSLTASCTLPALTPTYAAPAVASGYTARLVATGLTSPRSIIWDDAGHLLVLQQDAGIISLLFDDDGGACLSVREKRTVVSDPSLNHGLALSASGEILYASTPDKVLAYDYDQGFPSVGSSPHAVVSGMYSGGHTTRTLLVSRRGAADQLLVSRGSNANIDAAASDRSSGRCQLKAFDASNAASIAALRSYDFTRNGSLLGWGLRNSVGVAQHPRDGGVWSVENSIDQMLRDGVDIHEDNPGEELNFHGYLGGNGSGSGSGTGAARVGGNYGYPDCFAVRASKGDGLGEEGLRTGMQMVMQPNATLNDAWCARERVAPRLTFPAHTAPLDIVFTPDGLEAWITFHGSWNRDPPTGYKLSKLAFSAASRSNETYAPAAAADTWDALEDVLWNADVTACARPGACFRPVGLAFDPRDPRRVFMTSDATGEVYVVVMTTENKSAGTGTGAAAGNGTAAAGKDGEGKDGEGKDGKGDAKAGTSGSARVVVGDGVVGGSARTWAWVGAIVLAAAVGAF